MERFTLFTEEGGSAGDGAFYRTNIGAKAFITLQSTSGKVGSKVGILWAGIQFVVCSEIQRSCGGEAHALRDDLPDGDGAGGALRMGLVTVTMGSSTLTSTVKFTVHDSWGALGR